MSTTQQGFSRESTLQERLDAIVNSVSSGAKCGVLVQNGQANTDFIRNQTLPTLQQYESEAAASFQQMMALSGRNNVAYEALSFVSANENLSPGGRKLVDEAMRRLNT